MTDIEVLDASSVGLIRDVESHLLKPEAWSTAYNARFREGRIEWMGAKLRVLSPPLVPPYFAAFMRSVAGERYVFYWGLQQAYAIDPLLNHVNVSRAGGSIPYAGVKAADFNGTVLGGIPIFNNGVDRPQYWSPVLASQDLQDLPNIPSNERAKVFRAIGPYLCAYNVTIGVDKFPHMIHWAHPADPGSVPVSWDEADPTRDAGKNDLSDSENGVIVDARTLKGQMYVYKENSVWLQRITGGRFVFSFDKFLESVGVLAPRCVVPTGDGKYHFVVTQDDIIIHDGTTVTSLLPGRMKQAVFNALDAIHYENSFVFAKPENDEMWFCYPEGGNINPTRALIWNYGVKSDLGCITEAAVDFQGTAMADLTTDIQDFWDIETGVWDKDFNFWDSTTRRKTLAVHPVDNKFTLMDAGSNNDGNPVLAMIARTALAIGGTRRGDEWVNDFTQMKFCKRMWLRASGAPFQARVGTQDVVNGPLTWSFPMNFDPDTMLYVDFLTTGPVLAIEFSGTNPFSIQGYKLEVYPAGRFLPLAPAA